MVLWESKFIAITQVSCVAESRHDVLMLVHSRVDGTAPDGCLVVRQCLLDVVDALRSGNDAANVDALWSSLGYECLVAQLHAAACGKHRIGNDEVLLVDARCGKVLDVDAYLVALVVLIGTVGADESIAGMVENLQKSGVERQSGTEDGSQDNLVGRYVDLGNAQWSRYVLLLVIESL